MAEGQKKNSRKMPPVPKMRISASSRVQLRSENKASLRYGHALSTSRKAPAMQSAQR